MKTFVWLLKREFWEHRTGLFWTPLAVAGVQLLVLVGVLVIAVRRGGNFFDGNTELAQSFGTSFGGAAGHAIAENFLGFSMPLLFVAGVGVIFLALNSLYDDRKDRSVLFWKSLPASDTQTVLSKLGIALVVAPAIVIVVATVAAFFAALLICTVASFLGVNLFGQFFSSAETYLAPLKLIALWPIYALWALPTLGWLLMVSAWAKSKPFLWAIGVPLIIGMLATWANALTSNGWNLTWYWKDFAARLLLGTLPGSWITDASTVGLRLGIGKRFESDALIALSYGVLAKPHIWIGAVAGIAMIYAAIRLRRWRDEG